MERALDRQVGGDHYRHFLIQPVDFITLNRLSFLEGCIVKRVCRYKSKGGLEDLRKIQHEVELLIDFYYGEKKNGNTKES